MLLQHHPSSSAPRRGSWVTTPLEGEVIIKSTDLMVVLLLLASRWQYHWTSVTLAKRHDNNTFCGVCYKEEMRGLPRSFLFILFPPCSS